MTLDDWLATGIAAGYCGPPICDTHDGTPTTADEDAQYENGYDPCFHILRLYPDTATKAAVEANHSPSQWRNP
jgi:hypothetical protein